MDKKKNIIIGILIAVVALMGVGYATLAQVLTINGTATVTGTWDVRITGIELGDSEGATNAANSPSYTATSATFSVELAYPTAFAAYLVTIENRGTINARLSGITGLNAANAAASTDVIYKIIDTDDEYVSEDEFEDYSYYDLPAGESVQFVVAVGWNPMATTIPNVATKSATINFNYVQDTRPVHQVVD